MYFLYRVFHCDHYGGTVPRTIQKALLTPHRIWVWGARTGAADDARANALWVRYEYYSSEDREGIEVPPELQAALVTAPRTSNDSYYHSGDERDENGAGYLDPTIRLRHYYRGLIKIIIVLALAVGAAVASGAAYYRHELLLSPNKQHHQSHFSRGT